MFFNGMISPEQFPVGTVIKETVWFDAPNTLIDVNTSLVIGQYDADTLERVPLVENHSNENAIVLKGIIIRGNVLYLP